MLNPERTNESIELPEYQIFHILRRGQQEPIGPYSQDQLVSLLNDGHIHASDYVYYPELAGWKPMSQVFEMHERITNFADDGQDPQVVADSFATVNSHLLDNEQIYYVAVQQQPALSLTAAVRLTSPKSVVVTSHRICVLNPKLIGDVDFTDYPLEQVNGGIKRLPSSDSDAGIFNIVLKSGEWVEIDKIPAYQLDRLEQLVSEIA